MNQITDDQAYLRIENLSKVYATRDGEVRALNGVSFTQQRGEFISHVGPSGCGKSTLADDCRRTAFRRPAAR